MDGMFTLKELESNPSPFSHEATLTAKTLNQEDIKLSPNRAYLGCLFIKALFSTKLFLAQLHWTNNKSWFLMKKKLVDAGNEPRPVQSWGNQPTTELNQEEDVLSKLAFFSVRFVPRFVSNFFPDDDDPSFWPILNQIEKNKKK